MHSSRPRRTVTPIPGVPGNLRNTASEACAQPTAGSVGSPKTGPIIAPATADTMPIGAVAVLTNTCALASSWRTAVVSPDTPAPITTTLGPMATMAPRQDG